MPIQPSVITEDAASPQAGQNAAGIASNLNQAADRFAAAARQRAQLAGEQRLQESNLKAQEKLAQAQLDASAAEHAKYQQFQSDQADKERAAQAAAQQRAQDFQARQQHDLFAQQDKLAQRSLQLKLEESKAQAARLSSAADIADKYKPQIDATRKAQRDTDNAIAATQTILTNSMGAQEQVKKFLTEDAAHANSARLAAGNAGSSVAADSIRKTIASTLEDQSETTGVKGVFKDTGKLLNSNAVTRIGGAFNPLRTLAAPTAFTTALLGRIGVNIADYAGYATPVAQNALNQFGNFAEKAIKEAAPDLAKINHKGASQADVEAALTNALQTAYIAKQSYRADGTFAGGDSTKAMNDAHDAFSKLQDLIGADATQGFLRQFSHADDIFDSAFGQRFGSKDTKGELYKSEKEARKTLFDDIKGVATVYENTRHLPNSKTNTLDYNTPVNDFVGRMMSVFSRPGQTVDDFIHEFNNSTGMNATPVEIAQIYDTYKKFGGENTPEHLQSKMEELKARLKSQGLDLDTIRNDQETDTVRATADIQRAATQNLMLKLLNGDDYNQTAPARTAPTYGPLVNTPATQ